MKKTLISLLAVLLIFSMVFCSLGSSEARENSETGSDNPYGLVYAEDQTLHIIYTTEASSLHPFKGDSSAGTWEAVSNLTEGLETTDQYGNFIPGLAESIDISEDEMVYTYHLRQGLHWVDWEGNEKDPLTAQDFVTSAQYICNPANAAGGVPYFDDVIAGATELLSGEETDMSTLGFKALDDYTVEVTLAHPLPYFKGYGEHFLPMCTSLVEELGDNYGMDNESLYYIGPYRLTSFEPQAERIYEKNNSYYDADNVHIEKIIATYNAESSALAPEMFRRGEVDMASLGSDIITDWLNSEDTKDIVIPGQPDSTYMYFYAFNFWPQFDEQYDPDTWNKAIDNENFRQSLYWGIDRVKAKMAQEPLNPEAFLSNTICAKQWATVDGIDYTEMEPIAEYANRPNWGFDPDKALEYRDKAVEELTAEGVTFPIKVYMPYNPTVSGWAEEIQVIKQQLTDLFGADYLDITIEAGPSTGFLDSVRRSGKYAFMKCNTGTTIHDPEAWTTVTDRGGNWTFLDQASGPNVSKLVEEYYELLDYAKTITSNSVERYEAFAAAEAFLIEHALVIPFHSDTTGYTVTRLNPFEGIHNTDGKYKYYHVLAEPLTTEQYNQIYADWLVAREESIK